MRPVRRMLVLFAATMAAIPFAPAGPAAASGSNPVLPPDARPFGWSLERMTGALALFTASGNDPANYPDTPFQILHVKREDGFQSTPVGDGFRITGASTFRVRPRTLFFVPMANVNDSPPFPAPFPASRREAIPYFFGFDHYGAFGWRIKVDRDLTLIGPRYLAGPVTTPPLPDGGGTHIATLGAFLAPLPPGTHTVTVAGGLFGRALAPTYGPAFLSYQFTYTVIVG